MSKTRIVLALAVALGAGAAFAQVTVGGKPMFPTKNIIENAVNSADHTTLVAAVKAADLVSPLQGKGPFTVFAPVNTAFQALPAGTVETLLKPENKPALTGVLTYHVVAGRLTFNDLRNQVKKGGGKAELKTLAGGMLTVMMNGPVNIVIKDEKGGVANINVYDVIQSNGVIHSIDKVLLPR
jgi:uncharacterized surface protein with fasciclin (FAS1) repeats